MIHRWFDEAGDWPPGLARPCHPARPSFPYQFVYLLGNPSRKLVIIGDGACGKTSLLSVFTLGYFPTVCL